MIALVIFLLVIIIILFWRAIQLMDQRDQLLKEIALLVEMDRVLNKGRALERLYGQYEP